MTRFNRLSFTLIVLCTLGAGVLGLSGCGANESAAASKITTIASVDELAKMRTLLPELSGDDIWTMDTQESMLTFEAYYNGDFTGEFTRFQTAIKLDPNALGSAEIHAVIDLTSVAAKDDDVRSNLLTKDWFHTAVHPYAVFSAKDIKRNDGGDYLAAGELTIKGVSKAVDLPFRLTISGDSARAMGTAELSRMSFNIGEGSDFAGEDWVKFGVRVKVDIAANK